MTREAPLFTAQVDPSIPFVIAALLGEGVASSTRPNTRAKPRRDDLHGRGVPIRKAWIETGDAAHP